MAHPSVSTSLCPLSQSPPRQPIANISLPDPPPIQPALLTAGALPKISLAIEQAYQKRAVDLRAFYHSALTLMCTNQAQYPSKFRYLPEEKVLPAFIELYLRQLVTWREQAVASYLKYSSTKTHTSSCTAKFNHVRLMSCLRPSSPLQCPFYLTGICPIARIFFRREPVSNSC
jgi:hypothetical protein